MAEDKKTKTAEAEQAVTPEVTPDISALVAELVAKELAKAQAEAQAEADAKKKAETEAEKKQREEDYKKGMEMVPCFIPFVEGEPEEVTIGFNGKLYKIMKGEEVEVPRFIHEIIVRSGKMQMANHRRHKELEDVELDA